MNGMYQIKVLIFRVFHEETEQYILVNPDFDLGRFVILFSPRL
jgi:hypothetical protein